MEWLWIAALAWVVLAIPLALVTGRYLVRADERRARLIRPTEAAPHHPADGPAPNSPPDPARPVATRRSRPLASARLIARSVHPKGRERRASEPEPEPEESTTRPPSGSQRRRWTTPHWR